jgi:NAD(P)-dependent dehydrogenase (short-subunit alcohol dehydrogenase family)
MIMTQCLALELAPKIRVNTIVPGLTLTAETEQRFGLDDQATLSARQDTIPLQRIGRLLRRQAVVQPFTTHVSLISAHGSCHAR